MPVEPIQSGADPARELLQASDHQLQAVLGLVRRGGLVALRLQSGEALLQPAQPRLELVGVDDLLGIAVDQAVHAAAQARDLPLQPRHVLACLAVPD
ncbi:MAG TPA: hypothetical protein VJ885_10415 [Thermoanaerobaculia bacterium]|nr:hypothetical protein [Thermoanaerobaculia bacterium]